MGRARNLADVIGGNFDIPSTALDNAQAALEAGDITADLIADGAVTPAKLSQSYQTPLTAGTDYQTPLTAGTDYLAPDGDGSGLSGIASDALSSTFNVRSGKTINAGKAISYAASDSTVGYYPVKNSVSAGATGNNTTIPRSFDRTGTVGIRADGNGLGYLRFKSIYKDANNVWQEGSTYDYTLSASYGPDYSGSEGRAFPLPGADRAFLLVAITFSRTGLYSGTSQEIRIRYAVATMSTTGTFSVGTWQGQDWNSSGAGSDAAYDVYPFNLDVGNNAVTFIMRRRLYGSDNDNFFKVTGTTASGTSNNSSSVGYTGITQQHRFTRKRNHYDSASGTLLALDNGFSYRTRSWNGSDILQGVSDTSTSYSYTGTTSTLDHAISKDGNYVVQLFKIDTLFYIRVLSVAYSSGSVTLTEESVTYLPSSLQAVFTPQSGGDYPSLHTITDTKWIIRGALGSIPKLLGFEINDDGSIYWSSSPTVMPTGNTQFWQLVTDDNGDTIRIIQNESAPARTDTVTMNAYGEPDPFSYVGVAETTQSTSTAKIVTKGVASGFTGLTPSKRYYVSTEYDGSITEDADSGVPVGLALSSTELLVE